MELLKGVLGEPPGVSSGEPSGSPGGGQVGVLGVFQGWPEGVLGMASECTRVALLVSGCLSTPGPSPGTH